MQVGRKIYFDRITGDVIWDKGEMEGDVKETTVAEDSAIMPAILESRVGFVQLVYGERLIEFMNAGKVKVDPDTKNVLIYPRLKVSTNKIQITADGIDKAAVTVDVDNDCNVNFRVSSIRGDENYQIPTTDKKAIFDFVSEIPGKYFIDASSELYGDGYVLIDAVSTTQ